MTDRTPRLAAYLWRYRSRYLLGGLLLALYQLGQYWFDTRLAKAVDRVIAGDSAGAMRLGVGLVTVAVAAFAVRVLSRIAIFNAGRIAEYDLRKRLLGHLHRMGPRFFTEHSAGDLLSRATNDLTQVRLLLGFVVLNLVNTVLALVSALSVTLTLSPRLTLAALTPLPLLVVLTRRFSRRIFKQTREAQDALGALSGVVQSSVTGVRVVRSFGLEAQELDRFRKENALYVERSLGVAMLRGSMGPLMQAVAASGLLIVFWYGGHLLLTGALQPGAFLAFYRALARLTWPLIALGFLIGLVQRARAGWARLAELFAEPPETLAGVRTLANAQVPHLSVRGLSFALGGRQVLEQVSFELSPGQALAVVGRTGSGKSVLAALIARRLPTPVGAVFFDDVDVTELSSDSLHRTVGIADQAAFLFSTTVGRNIGFSLEEPDGEEGLAAVQDAAREAQVLEELRELPDGFDTIVGERGVQLSGGQRQRVALARTLLHRPRVLVLDDPIAAVDSRTEASIVDHLEARRAAHGILLITHRLSAAARCDSILVLEAGRVVQRGTHEELLQVPGIYAELWEEQRIAGELAQLAQATVGGAPRGVEA